MAPATGFGSAFTGFFPATRKVCVSSGVPSAPLSTVKVHSSPVWRPSTSAIAPTGSVNARTSFATGASLKAVFATVTEKRAPSVLFSSFAIAAGASTTTLALVPAGASGLLGPALATTLPTTTMTKPNTRMR